ncbi:MAG: SBBP repeat-containing protein [Candidatus Thorarchaeota archaeon]
MTKTILATKISAITLLSLLFMANCAQYPGSGPVQHERKEIPNIIRESREISEVLEARVTETLRGFTGGFLENTGQKSEKICYFTQSSQVAVGFGVSTLWFTLSSSSPTPQDPAQNMPLGEEELLYDRSSPTTVSVTFPGSNPVVPLVEAPTGAYSNYYRGADAAQWSTHNPYYGKLLYPNLYEHIDLVYELCEGQLKYEFIVNPGGTPASIRIHWNGPVTLSLLTAGLQITIETVSGPVVMTDSPPLSYQGPNVATPIPSNFFLENPTTYGFSVPTYDPARPLIIDPMLSASTFLGGTGADSPYGLAVDGAGNVWVGGQTVSANFPTTPDANDTSYNSGDDIFLAHLSADGTTLLSSTFLGGSGNDDLRAMALDAAGNVWASGSTTSGNFPTTLNALNDTHNGGTTDVFLAQLAANGSILLFATYLGGSGNEGARALAFDAAGNVWVTFTTSSTNVPMTDDALNDTHNGGTYDVLLAQLAADGSALLYSTYLGGSGDELGWALALDAVDNVWVTGYTKSGDFPTTANALNDSHNGGTYDVFLAQLAADGSALLYSTYLGGDSTDDARSLAIDGAGNVWFTGYTDEGTTHFPTTADAVNSTYNEGPSDVFVAKLAADGSALLYSTLLGGGGSDQGEALALDGAGNVWVMGSTSLDFPITPDAVNTTNPGGWDAFVAQFAADGSALLYSTLLGGDANEEGRRMALDAAGNVWLTGYTADHATTDFPTSPDALNTTHNGGDDAFLCALMFTPSPPQTLSAAISADNVTLTWAVPATQGGSSITAYRVYRSTTSGVYGAFLAETAATTFNDSSSLTIGVPYYYMVTAVNSNGESYASNEVTVILTLPSTPTTPAATPGIGSTVVLTWGIPSNPGSTPITAYRVYRSNTSGVYDVFLNETATTTFNDSTVVLGITYYYVVTAVNSIGESLVSTEANITLTAPSAPQTLFVVPGAGPAIILTWGAPASWGSTAFMTYRVYRNTTSGVYGVFLAETPNTTYTDSSSFVPGTAYYYVVTAVSITGESPVSNEVTITLNAPSAPQTLTAVVHTSQTVILTWGAPATQGTTAITTYHVYRSTTSGVYGTFLAETPNTTYTDAFAFVREVPYYYVVTAVNSIGESPASNEATITITEIVEQISGLNNNFEVSDTITVSIDVSTPVTMSIKRLSTAPAAPSDLEPIGVYLNITLSDPTALQGMWINISFIEFGSQDPSNARIFYFDETTQSWELVNRTSVDYENEVVWAWTDHLTVFGVMSRQVAGIAGEEEDWLLTMLLLAVAAVVVLGGLAVALYLTAYRQRKQLKKRRREEIRERW